MLQRRTSLLYFIFHFCGVAALVGQADDVYVTAKYPSSLNGKVAGSVRIMNGGWFSLNSGADITGDLIVPGIPSVNLNGSGFYSGTIEGSGSSSPSGYTIQVNSNASMGYLYNRIDGELLAEVFNPPSPAGTRWVSINQPGEDPGDFSTIKGFTLNSNAGIYHVPTGNYGQFTANSGSGFQFGTQNNNTTGNYAFDRLNLNSMTTLEIVGPVEITLKNGSSINALEVGNPAHPEWLKLKAANGSVNLNTNVRFYGHIHAPKSTVTINGGATLFGSVVADRVNINSGGSVVGMSPVGSASQNQPPTAFPDSLTAFENQSISIILEGSDPEGESIGFAITQLPAKGVLGGDPPNLIYTPDPYTTGSDSFTFSVSDGEFESVSATVGINVLAAGSTDPSVVLKYPPNLNGRIEGTVRFMESGWMSLNSGAEIVGNLIVPGIPAVNLNGNASYLGTIEGSGAATPSGYTIQINGDASMGYLFNRLDAEPLPTVFNPPSPPGSRWVSINQSGQDPGDFSTIKGVTLNSNVGVYEVPPGTYGPFTANSESGFRLGTANASTPDVYHFERLNLNSNAYLEIVGPVEITLKYGPSLNASLVGNADHPEWLFLNVANGSVNLNANVQLSGHLLAPRSTVGINGGATLQGSLVAQRLNLNSNGTIIGLPTNSGASQNQPPEAQANFLTLLEDSILALTLQGIDPEGSPLTFTVIEGPTLGLLSGSPPNLTYVPNPNANGSDAFTFVVSDGELDSAPAVVNLTITSVNDSPVAIGQSITTQEDVPLSITLSGFDVENDTLAYSITHLPVNGQIFGTPPDLTYAPHVNFNGEDSIQFLVNDGSLESEAAEIIVTVMPVNDRPEAVPLNYDLDEDGAAEIVLSGSDPDNDVIDFSIQSLPTNGNLVLNGTAVNSAPLAVSPSDTLLYLPSADFAGTDNFPYVASDGSLISASTEVTLIINPVNDPPVIQFPAGGYTTLEDEALVDALTIVDNDSVSLELSVTSAPGLGNLELNDDGSFVYTPVENANGNDMFEVTVDDGFIATVAEIPIGVNSVEDPPLIGNNSFALSEDTPLSGEPFEVEEVDGDTLSFILVTQPTQGTAQISGTTFNYMPDADANGSDSFQVDVTDGNHAPLRFSVTLNIQPVPDTPEAYPQSLYVDKNSAIALELSGNDPDGEPLFFAVLTDPRHGNLTGTAPILSYTPDTNYVGPDSFDFSVSAGGRTSIPATVSFEVLQTNEPPSITSTPEREIYFQIAAPSDGPENRILEVEVTVRDFSDTHPDFQNFYSGLEQGLVATPLDADGKPVFVGAPNQGAINSQATFSQWYRDVPGVNQKTTKTLLVEETEPGSGIFRYENLAFFLIDDELMGNEGRNHNFHYTMEWHGFFTYRGGEVFNFLGDDDIYLFVNGNLVVDIGGVHTEEVGSVDIDTLGLTIGEVYPFDLFYAERFTDESHLTFETSIEVKSDGLYSYQVVADDVDGDDLTYTLVHGPPGMMMDPSGLVTWIADITDIGSYSVEVEVVDTSGAADTQTYTLVVKRNFAPSVDAGAGSLVRFVTDPMPLNGQVLDDGNPVGFTLTQRWVAESGPSPVSIGDPTQQVTTASANSPGVYVFSLEGDDGELIGSDQKEVSLQPRFEASAPDDLIAWWSGNNNSLDKIGNYHALYALERNYVDAVAGTGFDFSDSRGYLKADVSGDLDLTTHTGFSFEFWVSPGITPTDSGYIAQFGDPQDFGIGIFFERSLSQQLSLQLPLAGGGFVWADAFPFFEFGSEAWVHVVITYDSISGIVAFYKDGINLEQVDVGTLALKSQSTLHIPQFRPDLNQGFNGRLDEFSVYKRALAHNEVLELYRNDIFGKPQSGENTPPSIAALDDLTFTSIPPVQTFSANVTDDNLPFNAAPDISWEVFTDLAAPSLSSTTGSSVDVTFAQEGTYTFLVTATDGAFTTTEEFSVRIVDPTSFAFVDDLVAWWDGNATTIDRVNGLEALPLADETYVDGQVGAAFLLDDKDDRFQVAETPILDLGAGDGFSVEFWFKNSGSEKGRIIEWWKDEVPGVTIDKNAPFTNALLIEVWDTSGVKHGFAELGYFAEDQWEHIAITYDKVAGVLRFYLNGAFVREWTGRFFEPRTSGDFFIGGRPIFFPTESPDGSLDELGLYSRALAASEIQDIYNAGAIGKVPAPINQVPVANAGVDQSVPIHIGVTLSGSGTDDGLPAGHALSYLWEQISGPGASVIAVATAPSTSVSFPIEGSYEFRLTVSDGELSGVDTVSITVTPAVNLPPAVSAGEEVTTYVDASLFLLNDVSDDGLPVGVVTSAWTVEPGAPGTVHFAPFGNDTIATFSDPGIYTLTLTGDDGEYSVSDSKVVTLLAGSGLAILSPVDGDEISAPTDVVVMVQSPELISHTLQYRSLLNSSSEEWVDLATGTENVGDAVVASFDPTMLLNGPYEMRLTADTTSSTIETAAVSLFVDGSMKVGNFALAFQDMTVPGIGIPIEIVRSYDSRDTRLGDFGVGWQLAIRNLTLKKNRDLHSDWYQTLPSGDPTLQTFYVDPVKEKYVTIRLPDDSLQRFRLGMVVKNRPGDPDNCSFGVPVTPSLGTFEAHYYPVGDSRGSLVSVGLDDLPDNQVYIQGTGTTDLSYDFVGFEPYNPTRFKYTTNEGTEFIIDEVEGLLSVTDRNQNTLTLSADGISHSSGRSVTFVRNGDGMIETIVDPDGNLLSYTYDALNRLIQFSDRESNETRFFYENVDFPYYLTQVLDPRGVEAIRTEFDTGGRMIKQVDADGNEIEFTHDLVNFTESVEDRLGHVTRYEFDDNGNVVRKIDPQLHETTYTYDENDNELTVTDHLGNTTTRTYDGRNNPLTEEDPLGNLTTFTYDAFSNPLTITNARNKITTFTYGPNGNLSSQLDAENNLTYYDYDASGNLTSITDPLHNLTEFVYDSLGNQRRVTVKDSQNTILRDTAYTYDANGNQVTMTQGRTTPAGLLFETTRFEYDRENRLVKTIYPDGSFTRTVYNSFGKQASAFDELDRETRYEYDDRGNLGKTIFPDNTFEEMTYDLEGRRSSSTDRRGFTTFYFYDEVGRLTDTVYPDGTPTDPNDNPASSSVYDELGRVTTRIDELGNLTRFEYDPNCGCSGRRSKVIDALHNETAYVYDENGNQELVIDALNRVTTFTYDDNDRPVQVLFDDNSTTETEYDALGRRVAEIDQAGNKTSFFYDPLGRLIQVDKLEPDGSTPPDFQLLTSSAYGYDESGNLISQVDAENRETSFEYDSRGRRTNRTLPGGESETMTYNLNGTLATKTDMNGFATSYVYDAVDRLVEIRADPAHPSLSLAHAPARITYAYNDVGQPVMAVVYNAPAHGEQILHAMTMTYDARGRLIEKAADGGTLTYGYDAAGNLKSSKSSNPEGFDVAFDYDVLNRLSSVGDQAFTPPETHGYTYDPVGNLSTAAYANGVMHTYTYNNLNRLTDLSISNSASAILSAYNYQLNAVGHRTRVQEADGRVVDYEYDNLYRLTREVLGGTLPNPAGAIDYTYDQVGNRLNRTSTFSGLPNQVLGYDENDRLDTDSYDDNGNTIASTSGGVGVTDTYSFMNRLIRRVTADGKVIDFTYDANGTRIRKTVTLPSSATVTTNYLVDSSNHTGFVQVVEEQDEFFQVLKTYTYGHDLISVDQLAGAGWELSYYLYDGHGNVRGLADALGAITDTYVYDAFGTAIEYRAFDPATNSLVVVPPNSPLRTSNSILYTGEQFDFDLGMYFLRARYYNPGNGRFHTMDNFEGFQAEPMSLHKYLYAHANPVMGLDPSGNAVLTEFVYSSGVAALIQSVAAFGSSALIGTVIQAQTLAISKPLINVFHLLSTELIYFSSTGAGILADASDSLMQLISLKNVYLKGIAFPASIAAFSFSLPPPFNLLSGAIAGLRLIDSIKAVYLINMMAYGALNFETEKISVTTEADFHTIKSISKLVLGLRSPANDLLPAVEMLKSLRKKSFKTAIKNMGHLVNNFSYYGKVSAGFNFFPANSSFKISGSNGTIRINKQSGYQ